MKIESDYIKEILNVFYESNQAHLTWQDVEAEGLTIDDGERQLNQRFLAHLQVILEHGWLSNEQLKSTLIDVGIELQGNGEYRKLGRLVRLTANGYAYLTQPDYQSDDEGW